MSPETRTLQRLANATEAHARSQEVQRPPPTRGALVRWCAGGSSQLHKVQYTDYSCIQTVQLYTACTALRTQISVPIGPHQREVAVQRGGSL